MKQVSTALFSQKTFSLRLLFLVLLVHFSIKAQEPSHYILDVEELKGVQIYDIIQNTDKNYLFATNKGVFIYDYIKCINILPPDAKSQSAFNFIINKKGDIYCHNLYNQIFHIQGSKMRVFYELTSEESSSDVSLELFNDEFLLVKHLGITILNSSGKVKERFISNKHCFFAPYRLSNGDVILHKCNSDSVLIYNGKFAFHKLKVNIHSEARLAFFKMDNKLISIDLITGRQYLVKKENWTLEPVQVSSSNFGLNALRVYQTKDRFWFASTSWGLNFRKVLGNSNKSTIWKESETILSNYFISKVYEDQEGNILLGTFDKGLIVVPNLDGVENLNALIDKPIATVTHLRNKVYLGLHRGDLLELDQSLKSISEGGNRAINVLSASPYSDQIVFDDGQVRLYDAKKQTIHVISKGSLKGVYFNHSKSIYIATNYGVEHIQIEENKDINSTKLYIKELRTYAIAGARENGEIYVATSDGLKFFTTKDPSFKQVLIEGQKIYPNALLSGKKSILISSKDGRILEIQHGKIVKSLIPQLKGQRFEIQKFERYQDKLIAITNHGLVLFDSEGKFLSKLDISRGITSKQIIDFDICNNKLWIVHNDGVQQLQLSKLNGINVSVPIVLKEIQVNGKAVASFKHAVFPHEQDNFKFTFIAPTLKNQKNMVYYYKLKGSDDKWYSTSHDQNEIEYKALSPGNYTFYVKAANQNSFSDVRSYSFRIDKAFYAKWWFQVLILLLFTVILALIFRRRLQVQRRKSKLLNELNASKLAAIQSQMNPHFIFNALNSIQDLVLKGDIDNSYNYITKFSNLVRRTLNYSAKDLIEFEQEIKLLELYLSLEKLRFKDKLSYQINCEGIDDILVPPMLIQPFIENSLLHGLLHKEGSKTLQLNFKLEDVLICEIIDNGIGRKRAQEIKSEQKIQHESFSSSAIQKRLEILSEHYQTRLNYTFVDLEEDGQILGTKVILRLPYKNVY